MYYAVAYDITDDRQRRRVSKTLENFGRRTQFSLFICQTDRRHFLLCATNCNNRSIEERIHCFFAPLPTPSAEGRASGGREES